MCNVCYIEKVFYDVIQVTCNVDVCDYPAAPATTPHKAIPLLITFIPILPSIQAVFRVFAIVFERYFFTFVPVVVDCLLLSVLSLLSTVFFFPGDIYLLFLKVVLWRCNAPYTNYFWKL